MGSFASASMSSRCQPHRCCQIEYFRMPSESSLGLQSGSSSQVRVQSRLKQINELSRATISGLATYFFDIGGLGVFIDDFKSCKSQCLDEEVLVNECWCVLSALGSIASCCSEASFFLAENEVTIYVSARRRSHSRHRRRVLARSRKLSILVECGEGLKETEYLGL